MTILITLLSFLLPTQLSYYLHFLNINVMGFNVDYLIPAVYLTDIIIVLIIFFGFNKIQFTKKLKVYLLVYLLFVLINLLVSGYFVSSLYKWVKITELVLLSLVLVNTKKFKVFNHFVLPLSSSMIIVNILGVLQFIHKGSIDGLFYLLGERSLSFLSPNVSGYPYSTFSHSNSFAGFLLVFVVLLLIYKKKFNLRFFIVSLLLSLVNLVLTNSLNVYITAGLLTFMYFFNSNNYKQKLLGSFIFTSLDLSQRFVTHRLELIKSSLLLINENFLLGVGLNNFIPKLNDISKTYINSWELQPVHNIFLLVFSELGVFGFIVFCILCLSTLTLSNYPLFAILLTGLNDHYWLTQQQNMLLFTFIIVLSLRKQRAKKYE